MNKKIFTPLAILIILLVIAAIIGVTLWICSEKEKVLPQDETADWNTYRNEEHGFEFQYPPTWEPRKDGHYPFIQLVQIKEGEVISIVGGISIINKQTSSPMESPYAEMFTSTSRCPDPAGSRNLSSPSQYEEYVYCLTGDEIEISTGTWKGAVQCSASWWATGGDFNTCPHQFWIDTKYFFFVVHFNFFQPIEKNSAEMVLFETFLKGFLFFVPSD